MGGKHKKANRTKNNERPSSSGRSAELISNKVDPSLVMVGPGKLMPAIFPSLGSTTVEKPLSNEFLLCFKKFHKKDSITKIKAINELKELVGKSEQEEVVNALSSWALYYPTLTVDIDRKVREVTQICHGEIVRKCGRQVALCIRKLLPAWLIARFDDFAPAQIVAETDLNTTFPNDKLAEAIKFCKAEIYSMLMDNLKNNTGYMLTGIKIDDEEEKKAQVARVTGCSLQVMKLLLEKLAAEQQDWLWDAALPLLCANSYWKLGSHSDPFVRASWYMATGSVVQQLAARLPRELARRAARSLLAPAERAPHVAAQRFVAVLKLMRYVEDWQEHLEGNNLLIVRIVDVLENGAWGGARELSALVLPLLTHMPSELLTCKLYKQIFSAMITGLTGKLATCPAEEIAAWSEMMREVLQFAAEAPGGGASLAAAALAQWAAAALPHRALLRHAARRMAALLHHWLQRAQEDPECSQNYEQMIANFWVDIANTTRSQIEQTELEKGDIFMTLDLHMLFILTLKSVFVNSEKEVQTTTIALKGILKDTDKTSFVIQCSDIEYNRLTEDIMGAAEELAARYAALARRHACAPALLAALQPLYAQLRRRAALQRLAAALHEPDEPDELPAPHNSDLLQLYRRHVYAWLRDGAASPDAGVRLAFILMHYMSDDEQDEVFRSFHDFPIETLMRCLEAALSAEHRGVARTGRWLRGAAVADALAAVCRQRSAAARALLLRACTATATDDRDGELLVGDAGVERVTSTLGDMLLALVGDSPELLAPPDCGGEGAEAEREDEVYYFVPKKDEEPELPKPKVTVCETGAAGETGEWGEWGEGQLEGAARLAGAVLRALAAPHCERALPLLRALFRLTLRIPRGAALLREDAWGDALAAWRDAAERLPAAARDRFVRSALSHVHWNLLNNMENMDIYLIEHLASLCEALAPRVDCTPPDTASDLVLHSHLVLDDVLAAQDARPSAQLFALQLDVLWGAFSCHDRDENDLVSQLVDDKAELTVETLRVQGYNAVFRALYIRAMLLRRTHEEAQDEGSPWCAAMLDVDYFLQQLADTVHDLAVYTVLADHYVFWRHHRVIREVKQRLERVVVEAANEAPAAARRRVAELLRRRAARCRGYWAAAARVFAHVLEQLRALRRAARRQLRTVLEMRWGDVAKAVFGSLNAGVSETQAEWGAAQLRAVEARLRGAAQQLAAAHASPLQDVIDLEVFDQLQMNAAITKRQRHRALLELRRQRSLKAQDFSKLEEPEAEADDVAWDDRESSAMEVKGLAMVLAYYKLCASQAVDIKYLLADFVSDDCKCYLDAVVNGYYRYPETMLYERDLVKSPASWLHVAATAAVVECLAVGPPRAWAAPAAHWDFANITLCSVLATLALSRSMWRSMQVSLLARCTLELFVTVRRFVRDVPAAAMRRQPAAHVAALPREWADIFGPDTHKNIYLFVDQVLEDKSPEITAKQAITIEWLIEAVQHLDSKSSGAALAAGPLSPRRLLRRAVAALADTSHHAFKYLAYHTLLALAPCLVELDMKLLANRPTLSPAEDGREEQLQAQLTLSWFAEPLHQLQELVDAALSNYEACAEVCAVAAHSDSHALALGYLLLALAAHRVAALPADDLALLYVDLFNQQELAEGLVPAAARLLPGALAAVLRAPSAPFPSHLLPYFQRPPHLTLYEEASSATVARLACWALRAALAGGGVAAARGWWAARAAARGAALQRVVAAAVAPALRHHQLLEVQRAAAARLLGHDVVLSTNVQEMWAMCEREVEERTVSVRICFSACHPLKPPRVVACAPAGPAACTDPHWLLVYLTYKNGRALKAMSMWMQALGGWLEPAPTCCVCYCRLHAADASEPLVPCRRCRNSFHSRCLRRWFQKSSRSSCPVCRTNF